jgi:hypothetical protein
MAKHSKEGHSKWRELLLAVVCGGVVLSFAGYLVFSPKFPHDFSRARILVWIAVAIMWGCYFWWLIERQRKNNKLLYAIFTFIGSFLLLVFALPTISEREEVFANEQLLKNPAELTPDNQPIVLSRTCGQPFNILIGGNVFGATHFPYKAVTILWHPFITLDMDQEHGLFVTFDVRDEQGNLLARVDRNVVHVMPSAYLVPRKTMHSLVIWDQKGFTALSINYANASTIIITGKFFFARNIYLLMGPDISIVSTRTKKVQGVANDMALCNADTGLSIWGDFVLDD